MLYKLSVDEYLDLDLRINYHATLSIFTEQTFNLKEYFAQVWLWPMYAACFKVYTIFIWSLDICFFIQLPTTYALLELQKMSWNEICCQTKTSVYSHY